jgi:hypothetical protein
LVTNDVGRGFPLQWIFSFATGGGRFVAESCELPAGATTRFRVSNGIEYDHSGQYMAVGPFEYAWP